MNVNARVSVGVGRLGAKAREVGAGGWRLEAFAGLRLGEAAQRERAERASQTHRERTERPRGGQSALLSDLRLPRPLHARQVEQKAGARRRFRIEHEVSAHITRQAARERQTKPHPRR